MHKVELIFFKASSGNIVDKAIAWWTSSLKNKLNGNWRDSYSHVEIFLSPQGDIYSTSQYGGAVRVLSSRIPIKGKWDYVEISSNMASSTYTHLVSIMDSYLGRKYDWLGILGFVVPFVNDNDDKMFCSEFCAEALSSIGKLPHTKLVSGQISPNKLYELITGKNL